MNVIIDRDRMVFLYAHESIVALLDIAWLETGNAPIVVLPLDHPTYFDTFSDLELKLLYKHTTGVDHTGFARNALMQVVCDLALRIPPLDANVSELAHQADSVLEGDENVYKYVKGSRKPKMQSDLFSPVSLRVSRMEHEEQVAKAGELRPFPAVDWPFAAPTAGDHPRAPTSTAPRTPRPAPSGVPPAGSTRETVWNLADKMWEDAGKPTAVGTVLSLRKHMMDALEQVGVKRTSSSNELGQWQKVRLTIS